MYDSIGEKKTTKANFVFMLINRSLHCPHCLSARATKNGRKKKDEYLYWGANKEEPLLTMLMLEWIALKACLVRFETSISMHSPEYFPIC
mgnify:CR=1 FL=1